MLLASQSFSFPNIKDYLSLGALGILFPELGGIFLETEELLDDQTINFTSLA